MENNELMDIQTEIGSMSTEEREMLATMLSATIAGLFHSIDRDKVLDNVKVELENLIGDNIDKEELEESMGEDFVTECVDAFMTMTGENVRQLIGEIGINMFAEVGQRLANIAEPEKLTTGEE